MQNHYITIAPGDLWKIFVQLRIYKGGGNATSPKMFGPNGPRDSDFDIRLHETTRVPWVYPNKTKGLSFAGSISRLERFRISGVVYEIRSEDLQELPHGLVIHYRDLDHPLINVAEPMPVVKAICLFSYLGKLMKSTGVKILPNGKRVG